MKSKGKGQATAEIVAPFLGLITRLPSNIADKPGKSNPGNRAASAVSNMRFDDGVIRNAPGYEPLYNTPLLDSPVNLIFQANIQSSLVAIQGNALIIGTENKLYSVRRSNNANPIVSAGPDSTYNDVNNFNLAGSAIDPEGNTLTYIWTKTSGPAAIIASPTSAATNVLIGLVGIYVFRLTASDGSGGIGFDDVVITISGTIPGVAPIVNAGIDILTAALVAVMDATATDPHSLPLSYVWTKVSGTDPVLFDSQVILDPTVTLPATGTSYTLRLTVGNSLGVTAFDEMTITVSEESPPDLLGCGPTVWPPATMVPYSNSGNNTTGWEVVQGAGWASVGGEIRAPLAEIGTSKIPAIIGVGGSISFELYWASDLFNNDDFYVFFTDANFEVAFGYFITTLGSVGAGSNGNSWYGWCQIREDGVIPAQYELNTSAATMLSTGVWTPVTITRVSSTILRAMVGAAGPFDLDTQSNVKFQMGFGYSTAISNADIRIRNLSVN